MKILFAFLLINLFYSCEKDDDKGNNPPINNYKDAYFVAVNGDDNNPGTYDKPWATWQKAFSTATTGDTVYIRGGVYYADNLDVYGVYLYNKSGTRTKPICIFNYPGEKPVLDCSSITKVADLKGICLIGCNYVHLKGLTVRGVQQYSSNVNPLGISIEKSKGNVFENCTSHANNGAGFYAYQCDSVFYMNCDAYDNFDRLTAGYSGGQADGFVACYAISSSHTFFKGCRSWYNSDDGFDCWENEGIVEFEECWSFNNGRANGDGCGFKLGHAEKQPLDVPQRLLSNCMAFMNKFIGFNQNHGNTSMVFYNNIAYCNSNLGFELSLYNNQIIVRNNISYKNGKSVSFSDYVIHDHNSWDASPNITCADDDFASIDSSGISGTRMKDGSLPVMDFLRLNEGSDLIDAGVDVGLTFLGRAPDIGPFEKE